MGAPWATVDDVAEVTGVTVTDTQLRLAQMQVELRVGRTSDATGIGSRDLRWLKKAVAYQAVWAKDQPDLLTRSETTGAVIQDGVHVQQSAQAQQMAPLALASLRRLSWRGNRTVSVTSTLAGPRAIGANPASLAVGAVFDYDGYENWRNER